MPSALVLQHVDVDAPALVAVALGSAGIEVVVHRTDRDGPPPALDGHDALVVMGGPQSAHSDDGFPTRRAELDLLADAVAREVPVLGVCLGAQMLAEATGGRALRGDRGLEVGWADVTLTPEAAGDALFGPAPATFAPLHWHGDTVVLPEAAVLLASSTLYPNQAFRIGPRAWGLQFHVEADRDLVEAFVAEWPRQADRAGGPGSADRIRAEAADRLDALGPATDAVLGGFAALVSTSTP
jgi:GMP synthase-like glutamine amidotransferase